MQLGKHETAIRERAYSLWEQEGRPDGREWDHWERASHEVLAGARIETPLSVVTGGRGPAKVAKTTKGRIRAALKSAISS